MVAGAGEVDEVEDLSDASAAPSPPSRPAAARARTGSRRGVRRWRGAAVVVVVALLLTAGLWQQHCARAAVEARAALAAAADARSAAGDDARVAAAAAAAADPGRAATVSAAAEAVGVALATATAGAGPAWAPVDLGAGAADLDGPVDLQAVGSFAPAADGVQRVGYRLVTGLGASAGLTPCQVPTVRISAWQYAQGGDGALACRVMAAGARGTAHREGVGGDGAQRVQVAEVVLVSGGRAASVAAWSTGGTAPSLELPALGAAAAALLAAAPDNDGAGRT